MFGSGWPFIAQTIIESGSIALAMRTPRDSVGLVASPEDAGRTSSGRNMPDGLTPAIFSTSASRTPVHSAQPAPPFVH